LSKITLKKLYLLTKDFLANLFEPKVSFYAASMSWATLFFIIPFLVILFSILIHLPIFSKYYDAIHQFIASILVPGSSKVVIEFMDKFVQNAGKLGVIGFIYVIFAAFLFFKDYDYIVNDIFNENRRGFFNALLVYGSLLIFIPISLAISIWFLVMLDSKLNFGPIILQFFIVWFLVFLIYKITPKEKIPIKIVAISSFIATFIWSVAKTLFIFYIAYNKTYTTIYGAISILLFLFLWIYISWVIFLHGLQLCAILTEDEDKN